MKNILLTTLIFVSQLAVASDKFYKVTINEGIVLTVKQFKSYRSLPHVYYDQATSSIPSLYPEYIYLAKRRYGTLEKMQYSLVCYKENKKDTNVIISGTAVLESHAWSFETSVSQDLFGDYLLIVLEAMRNFPSNKELQRAIRSDSHN